MLRTITTLIGAAQNRADDRLRDAFALDLIDQKIRESEAGLRGAKATLASLIQRQRSEERQATALRDRIKDLSRRASDALATGVETMAAEAADAIATMENELVLRQATLERLSGRILRLTTSVEAGHRRIIDLRQGAIQARAIRREQDVQMRLDRSDPGTAGDEAEALIARVIGRDDPFEAAEIRREIDRGLNHDDLSDRMADAGFGPATRATQATVLARLKIQLQERT